MTDPKIQRFAFQDGQAQLKIALARDAVWLRLAQMRQLFDTTPGNILMHLRNLLKSEGPLADATTKDFLVVCHSDAQGLRHD